VRFKRTVSIQTTHYCRPNTRRVTIFSQLVSACLYIQLYSPECTLAENININNNKQNKARNILINTVQLNTRYTFVNVLTKDITEDALGKFPHEFLQNIEYLVYLLKARNKRTRNRVKSSEYSDSTKSKINNRTCG